MPPLHHQVVTATLAVTGAARQTWRQQAESSRRALRAARRALRADAGRAGRHRGVGHCRTSAATSPRQAGAHLPVDTRASATAGKTVRALADAVRFPSDPPETHPRGERRRRPPAQRLARRTSRMARRRCSTELDGMFRVTSIRKGFVGGGFDGSQSLPKRMAMAAGVPGRRSDPRHGGAVPRLHVDAEGGSRARRGSRTSRRSATSTSDRAGTSRTARTCISRTCSRTSRRGT